MVKFLFTAINFYDFLTSLDDVAEMTHILDYPQALQSFTADLTLLQGKFVSRENFLKLHHHNVLEFFPFFFLRNEKQHQKRN